MDEGLSRRRFIQTSAGLLLAPLVAGCDPATERAPSGPRARYDALFAEGSTWGADWRSLRYENGWHVADDGARLVAGPAVPKSLATGKEVALYMGDPVYVAAVAGRDYVVEANLELTGAGEAGVIARLDYDACYALLLTGREAILCRYDTADRVILDRAPAEVRAAQLTLSVTGGRIEGEIRAGVVTVELAAEDETPLGAGHPGCLLNPTSAEVGAEARFESFSVAGGRFSTPRPRIAWRFAGALEGESDTYSMRVTASSWPPAPVGFELADDDSFERIVGRIAPAAPDGGLGSVHARFEDLAGDRVYHWRPRPEGAPPGPPASFRTPRADGSVRLVFASCTSGRVTDYPSFDRALALDPDLYLHAGDWGYADLTAFARRGDHFQARWVRLLRMPSVARMLARTPLLFWQDDHDYQADNGWSATVQPYAVDAFDELHANPSADYFDVRWGDVHIWCLDCRLHATDPEAPDGPGKSRIGAEQKEWLLRGMAASDAPVRIVGAPMVFRNKPGDDPGWHNVYTHERDELLASFASLPATVLILSGDSHGQRLIHHHEFGDLFEFNCSGTDFPGGDQGNNDPEHTLVNLTDSGFAFVELGARGPDRRLRAASVATKDGAILFEKTLPIRSSNAPSA